MAVEKPLVATSMEPFGSSFPDTDAAPMQAGVFKIDEPNALETPCEMVSIASTKEDMPKIRRNWDAWNGEMPDDNLNQPY